MKTLAAILILASAPALFAADTNSPPASLPAKEPPLVQVNLVEQADLVRQIGEEAARGFDPEAHAHWLREQIEALMAKPASKPTAMAVPAAAPAPKTRAEFRPQPVVSNSEAALRETIAKLRALASELEAQVGSH